MGLGLIICMELLQYVSMSGTLDVDDVLLNLIGVLVGFWLSPISAKKWF